MQSQTSPIKSWTTASALLSMLIAFAAGLVLIAHKLPAIGPLPRIGPFEAEPYRAGVFFLCVVVVVLAAPLAAEVSGRGKKSFALAVDMIVLLALGYASWRFFVDVTLMHDTIVFFEPYQAWTTAAACVGILYLSWRHWGVPLTAVAILSLIYFAWSFQGSLVDDLTENLWLALDDGILGNITAIVLSTVFPFIILGAMMESTGAGMSMLKISLRLLHKYRGGPAHAAVLGSGLFGTISGSSVANVVGTGVITIPLIKQRGFSPNFAGGVEATASTGGQIMPPIMGAAALILADFVGVSYVVVMTAAVVPAVFYYVSLFMTIVFESRRLGVEAATEISEEMQVTPQDVLNLVLILAPIGIIVYSLLRGLSPAGSALFALFALLFLAFINPDVRREPWRLVVGFARGSQAFAKLLIAVCCISIIVATMLSTGLPSQLSFFLNGVTNSSLLATLLLAAGACLLLGMGMPTLPAYLTIIIVLGSTMNSFGLEPLTAHFFVFYYGVASGITPPVAVAAYAAAAISGGNPSKTGFAALRIGIVIFVLPFFWVYNPEMLLVPEAGGEFELVGFVLIVLRLLLMTYLIATAASRFDFTQLGWVETALRMVAALALISPLMIVWGPAFAVGVVLVVLNRQRSPATVPQ
ncbi:TRAP transporter fused permease subunit [uncultured Ruegeria sp.]|uniref:TRAP transporter permease n=1 Tax=uncultured Ruegeria sp. TaxID=259304 RepID=UPI00263197BA|nr:TRAP transporter fused permease subunit [uncultured Ruegeria sp.]